VLIAKSFRLVGRQLHRRPAPHEHGRASKQEKLAELTGMVQANIAQYAAFGQFQIYISTPDIKPTLQEPLFFEREQPVRDGDGRCDLWTLANLLCRTRI
jgi:hypothetical protein